MNFMKYRLFYFLLSALVIVPGIFSLIFFRFLPSIDFTGGSLWEIQLQDKTKIPNLTRESIQTAVGKDYEVSSVQQSGDTTVIIRGKAVSNEQKVAAEQKIAAVSGVFREVRFETIGPILGKELLDKTLVAGLIVASFITIYIGYQFKSLKYGVATIVAMIHDSLVLLGSFSLLGHFMHVEVDVLFVIALLTTLSFSVHDTVVVFDRIRELQRKHPRLPIDELANAAILETIGRSINNSMTIIIMLLSLVLLGGETIRWFAVALLLGAVTGTYSSLFNAVPMLVVWEHATTWWNARQKRK